MTLDDRLTRVLRILAPGTPLREGLENILRARTGALIVVGDTPQVMAVVNGGFKLDCEFSPATIYELAKMDGAIILSHDLKRIIYANAHLNPDAALPSSETGMRHRSAERVARQTGELVIAISQRRNVITLYKANLKYVLPDLNVILAKANQALQTLERYKAVLDQVMVNLSALEFENLVTAADVVGAVQRQAMVLRIVAEIERHVAELGAEGRLIEMQLQELVDGVAEESLLLLRDYLPPGGRRPEEVRAEIHAWPFEHLLDQEAVARALGLSGSQDGLLRPKGLRVLRKIPRVPAGVAEKVVDRFGSLQHVLDASIEDLDEVEGIGEVRARAIQEGLRRLREQVFLDRHL